MISEFLCKKFDRTSELSSPIRIEWEKFLGQCKGNSQGEEMKVKVEKVQN